jgi:hypothetical protein
MRFRPWNEQTTSRAKRSQLSFGWYFHRLMDSLGAVVLN